MEEALAQMEGSTLADMLDFLSKELIRLQVTKKNVAATVETNESLLVRNLTYGTHIGLHRCNVKKIYLFSSCRFHQIVSIKSKKHCFTWNAVFIFCNVCCCEKFT